LLKFDGFEIWLPKFSSLLRTTDQRRATAARNQVLPIPASDVTKWLLADWLEARLLFGEESSASVASIADELIEEGTLSDLAVYDEVESDLADEDEAGVRRSLRLAASEGETKEELLAEEAVAELGNRADYVGEHYPFAVARAIARRRVDNWRDAPVYAFLTALNVRYLWRIDTDLREAARLFERLTVPALVAYWGGAAAHFGFPRDPAEEAGFRAALPALMARMRERLSISPEEIGSQHKDLALDAIAWRPLDDRPGQTVLLCQCSIGDDWAEKGVPLEKWTTLVNFAVAPSRGLAFPFIPDAIRSLNEVDWLLLCAGVGVPFDRLRIAHLLADAGIDPTLMAAMSEWTAAFAAILPGNWS
jgi:hypothetical protein